MALSRVAVIGAGTMGAGIAQVMAQHDREVTLVDVSDEALAKGMGGIEKSLSRFASKGKIEEDALPQILGRIDTATTLEGCAGSDLVIEAVPEDLGLKTKILGEVGGLVSGETILASNTSSISITTLGEKSGCPERFIGMHFMNPVPVSTLVEVIRSPASSDEVAEAVIDLAKELGKVPVSANDSPGFVSNRVLMPMINEAAICLMEGVAEAEAIDDIMKLGMAHPMGPLALADLIGVDVCLDIMEVLHHDFDNDKYCPCPLLRQMVADGHLGRKTGQGFHHYD